MVGKSPECGANVVSHNPSINTACPLMTFLPAEQNFQTTQTTYMIDFPCPLFTDPVRKKKHLIETINAHLVN